MNWIKIEDREPNEGQLVLVKGQINDEYSESNNLQIGLVNWNYNDREVKGLHQIKDYAYHSLDYCNVTEWCEVE